VDRPLNVDCVKELTVNCRGHTMAVSASSKVYFAQHRLATCPPAMYSNKFNGAFSGVATGGGRVPSPTFPRDQFWDSSKSDEKSVRLCERLGTT